MNILFQTLATHETSPFFIHTWIVLRIVGINTMSHLTGSNLNKQQQANLKHLETLQKILILILKVSNFFITYYLRTWI